MLIGRRTSERDRETGNREIKVGKYDAAAAFRERPRRQRSFKSDDIETPRAERTNISDTH